MSQASARHYDTLLAPVITEKSTLLSEHGKVVFHVPLSATKAEIAEAVEAIYGKKVEAVNTVVTKGKTKRFRGIPGRRKDVKKAIVTLADGAMIDMTTGL